MYSVDLNDMSVDTLILPNTPENVLVAHTLGYKPNNNLAIKKEDSQLVVLLNVRDYYTTNGRQARFNNERSLTVEADVDMLAEISRMLQRERNEWMVANHPDLLNAVRDSL